MNTKTFRFALILFLTPLFVGLSSCSDDPPEVLNYFRPPAWIQGTWIDDAGSGTGFTFTANNFIQDAPQALDFNLLLKAAKANGQAADAEETTDNTFYRVAITEGANSYNYKFDKVSSTQIRWTNPPAPSPQVTMSRK